MPHLRIAPYPTLRHAIDCLWLSERDFALDGALELLPDSEIELLFCFGAPCQIEDARGVHVMPRPCVLGPLDSPVRLRAEGIVRTAAVRFYAWGFLPFFDLDPAALQQTVSELPLVNDALLDPLEAAIWQGRAKARSIFCTIF
jgi:hypothetical protein